MVFAPSTKRRPDDEHEPDLSAALPSTIHNPCTVEGQIEQAGKTAEGLRARRHGWQRVVVLAGTALVVLAATVALVVLVVDLARG